MLIGRCGCGVVGCGDQRADVVLAGDEATWLLARGRRVVFDRRQYEAALGEGASSTAWESFERTAERLVGSLDFSARSRRGYIFQWASVRIRKGQITLMFTKDARQVMFDIGWNHKDPEDARSRIIEWIAADAQ